jgi:hypothetical protein
MEPCHDPVRQVDYLWQCLSQAKKRLGLFLGAGCPLGVGAPDTQLIPDLTGLTKVVCDGTAGDAYCQHSLTAVLEHLKADGNEAPTAEDILTQIRSMRAVVGQGEVLGLNATMLDDLDQSVCNSIVSVMGIALPEGRTPYHDVAAWVGATERAHAVEIFTTNYDLLIEQAMEEDRVPYFDGFVGSRRAFFDPHSIDEDVLPVRWARLWKLHGSINWYQDARGVLYRGSGVGDGHRRVIYPSHLKYVESRRMPYLAMIDRLRSFLRHGSPVLITCGYSFRDEHLNEVIIQSLQGNPSAMAFGLLFGGLDGYSEAVNVAANRSNLSVLAEDGGVIGTVAGKWLPAETTGQSISTACIKWEKAQPEDEDPIVTPRLALGDFACFGQFLREIVGSGMPLGGTSDEA